jgi:hypothetical protein
MKMRRRLGANKILLDREAAATRVAAASRTILEQEAKHGDLLHALTPDERDIIEVIESGANDPEHMAAETMLTPSRLASILDDLVSRGVL